MRILNIFESVFCGCNISEFYLCFVTQCRWGLSQSYLIDKQAEVPDNYFVKVMQTVDVVQVVSLSSVRQETDTMWVEKGDFFSQISSLFIIIDKSK